MEELPRQGNWVFRFGLMGCFTLYFWSVRRLGQAWHHWCGSEVRSWHLMCWAPRTGVSTKDFSSLMIVLLFYVVIRGCNEQVAGGMCHHHVDGNFIVRPDPSEPSFSWEGGRLRTISRAEGWSRLSERVVLWVVLGPVWQWFWRFSICFVGVLLQVWGLMGLNSHSFIQLTFSSMSYKDFVTLIQECGAYRRAKL